MDQRLTYPKDYAPALSPRETERAIRLIKDYFQTNLAFELNLARVTAPLFVPAGTGINDDLNGTEKPVAFTAQHMGAELEIVQSLAKWKRAALADLGFAAGEGLYTDMNAIRPYENLDRTHSLYVDQWDWEKVISGGERSLEFLMDTVRRIYDVIRRTEKYVAHVFPAISSLLPDQIGFVHAEDLLKEFPELPPVEREREACRRHGAVFVIGIGSQLADGKPHDGRAPDYDDWSTPTGGGRRGLNGDILVHNPVLDGPFELSSMGIRVDPEALERQLELKGAGHRRRLPFHQRLLSGGLPQTVGGGIGQSRLCMYYLRKAHIGEIQASVWPDEMADECRRNNIVLL